MAQLAGSGFRPSRALGQNFILDSSLLDFIVRSSGAGHEDVVLEIGAGAGQLTSRLAAVAGKVVSFEIDRRLAEVAARNTAKTGNVILVRADALAGKNRLNPELVDAVKSAVNGSHGNLMLVSNLAYSIATPVIILLLESGMPFLSMTVTVQLEAAEKLCACLPGENGYGPVSLIAGWFARAFILRQVPPEVFWPRPKVKSAIVRMETVHDARTVPGYEPFKMLVKAAFSHRRKTASSALAASGLLERTDARSLFESAGLDPMLRPEQMTPEGFRLLAASLQNQQ